MMGSSKDPFESMEGGSVDKMKGEYARQKDWVVVRRQEKGWRSRWTVSRLYKRLLIMLLLLGLFQFFGLRLFGFDLCEDSMVAIKSAAKQCSAFLALMASIASGGPVTNLTNSVVTPIDESSYPPWEQYVRSQSSKTILPVSILHENSTGDVENPEGLLALGGGVTFFKRKKGPDPPRWPEGTTANASSTHSGNFSPMNAIDGRPETFWNDDTIGEYPDVLTITTPSVIEIPALTILSNKDGVPMDLTVSYLSTGKNATYTTLAAVVGNTAIKVSLNFTTPVNTSSIRITVTRAQSSFAGEYTRINEVYPGVLMDATPIPTVIVDFGQVVVGVLSISFAGASDNVPGMRLAFSETTEFLTDVSDFSRSYNGDTITPGSDQIAVKSEPYVYTNKHGCQNWNTKQVCSDGLHGFRYVKIYLDALASDAPITTSYGLVKIDGIYLDSTPFLGTPDTFNGWFQCSDEELTQYWFDGAYTNDLNIDTFRKNDTEPRNAGSPTLIGKLVLMDGPKRDRDPYVGDLAISARTAYVTHFENAIAARNVLADLADHQRADGWIPPASINDYTLPLFDYPLWWVTCSYDYMLYTNDISYIETYYDNLVKVLDGFYPSVTDPTTGLLNKGLGVSAGYGDFAFLPRTGTITYYNALYVYALQNAAALATTYGYPDDAERWTQRAASVSEGVNKVLWDDSVGAFFDNLQSTTHGQDGNMISIITGIANANNSRDGSILEYWSSLALPYGNPFFSNDDLQSGFSKRVYAFISYFELEARFISGRRDSAIEEIKRLYGWMATHDPKITQWEGIGSDGIPYEAGYTSMAHGWSTGVVPIMTNYVLGINPTAPGFERWLVKPMPVSGVTWARGQVNTPKGELTVSWAQQNPHYFQFQIQVSAPESTKGCISVPVSRKSVIVFVDGIPAWTGFVGLFHNARYEDGYVTVDIDGGKHTVSVSK